MRVLRAFGFVIVAATALSVGAFIGASIAQPAVLSMLPWYQAGTNKV